MKLENQVCTLEQAKRLKELGLNVISYFHWYNELHVTHLAEIKINVAINLDLAIHAYTVAELGEMLPRYEFKYKDSECYLEFLNNGINKAYISFCSIMTKDNRTCLLQTYSGNEAKTRAQMLIYLIENKIIDVKTLNNETN